MKLGRLKKYTLTYIVISYTVLKGLRKMFEELKKKITGFKCSIKEHEFKFTLMFV